MSSLFAALQTSANSMNVFEKAIGVVQNNVTNATTPGYVTQSLDLQSRAFQPGNNLWGGVSLGNTLDSRSQFAEQAVWTQSQLLGSANQKATSLSAIQSLFDVTGNTGIPAAFSKLSAAFSSWSNTPTDTVARTQVLSAAQNVAQAFNQTSRNLTQTLAQTENQISNTVNQINQAVSQIQNINVQIGQGLSGKDAGLQAQLYNQLQVLSKLTPINVQTAQNGSVTVLMNGQVQLVSGDTQTKLHVAYPTAAGAAIPGGNAPAQIGTDNGTNVTGQATGGTLGGLLDVRNTTLPSVVGDQTQPGSLNQLAKSFADRVNNILASGAITAGPPPIPGKTIFTYDTSLLGAVAGTLTVDATVAPSDLGAIQVGTTTVSNGTANQLAGLQSSSNPADQISGQTFSGFYSGIATDLGNQSSVATQTQSTQTDLLNQAENLRSQISGVDLNAQAAQLLQFQKAYEASSKIISVVSEMTSDLMKLIQ